MGHGIAQTFSAAGCSVTVYDEVEAVRSTSIERIRSNLLQMAAESLIDASAVEGMSGIRNNVIETSTKPSLISTRNNTISPNGAFPNVPAPSEGPS